MDGKRFFGGVDDAFYAELRLIAGRLMRGGRQITFSATALVNEALLACSKAQRIPDDPQEQRAFCATLMFHKLVDASRRHRRRNVALGDLDPETNDDFRQLTETEELLKAMEKAEPRAARVVVMRMMQYTTAEIAAALGCTTRTVQRDLNVAEGFLRLKGLRPPFESAGDEA